MRDRERRGGRGTDRQRKTESQEERAEGLSGKIPSHLLLMCVISGVGAPLPPPSPHLLRVPGLDLSAARVV